MATKARKSRKPLTDEEIKARAKARASAAFRRKIVTTFKNAGFEYLKTDGIHRYFGLKVGELDYVFLYENIIIVCEDTTSNKKNVKDHLKNKKLLTDQITANKPDTIQWLKDTFPDKFSSFDTYSDDTYRIFHLYFTLPKLSLTKEDKELYQPIKVINIASLNYLHLTSQTIKKSSRPELFRFLGLKSEDIGVSGDGGQQKQIPASIIYPTDRTGLANNVRIVSFMMSADMLLRNSFVLRKDSWEGTIKLYQRLLDKKKLLSTRKYIADNGSTFFNNVIVSLPRNVTFIEKGQPVELKNLHKYQNCTMNIPDEMNTICVIDGQHRIFAHFEGDDNLEPKIAKLRHRLHLLVTGLIFPEDMSDLDRRKYESSIFADINSNAKPVPADVLLQINSLQEPYSDLAIARRVVMQLNDRGVFKDAFQVSQMDGSKIKIASIVKFALRYLVDITEDRAKPSLFQYWTGDKAALLRMDSEDALDAYIDYLVDVMNMYFKVIKSEYSGEWADATSKIRSITSLNGFIIALRKSLNALGVGDAAFYEETFSRVHHDFTKVGFPYGSSHYNKFAAEKLLPSNYQLTLDEDGHWVKQV